MLGIPAGVKYDHFKGGRTNRHLAVIIPVEGYHTIIGKNAWKYNLPADIDAYNTTTDNATASKRAIKEAEWKRKLIALRKFNSACSGAEDLIIYGVGEYSVVAINHKYVGYRGVIL